MVRCSLNLLFEVFQSFSHDDMQTKEQCKACTVSRWVRASGNICLQLRSLPTQTLEESAWGKVCPLLLLLCPRACRASLPVRVDSGAEEPVSAFSRYRQWELGGKGRSSGTAFLITKSQWPVLPSADWRNSPLFSGQWVMDYGSPSLQTIT
jgi:hypothetical protein